MLKIIEKYECNMLLIRCGRVWKQPLNVMFQKKRVRYVTIRCTCSFCINHELQTSETRTLTTEIMCMSLTPDRDTSKNESELAHTKHCRICSVRRKVGNVLSKMCDYECLQRIHNKKSEM